MATFEEQIKFLEAELRATDQRLFKLRTAIDVLRELDAESNGSRKGRPPIVGTGHTNDASRKVLDALRAVNGGDIPRKTIAVLAKETGLAENYVRKLLYKLRDRGRVKSEHAQQGPDMWALANVAMPTP